jgi:O-antigen/teichoic acid export membrane protein
MSVEMKAAKGATWLAIFQFSGQAVSWVATVIVARILVPSDYGLMEMATIITGYAFIFNELGLGHAIIQSPTMTKKQLSSVFWFSILLSLFFALFAFSVAYPTALIFNDPRIIPLTQTTSVLFIISGLQIIPQSLLRKEMKFKVVGYIDMTGVLVSCICMVIIAKLGGGVWTLIGGNIIRSFTRLVLLYSVTGWKPLFSFNFQDAKQFIQFGVLVALGRSLYYVYEKSDRFFAGRALPAKSLGLYCFALQLAMIPTDKIVPIINQVSYSAFAALQNEKERFNIFYLNISKMTATLVFPIFIMGFWLGSDLIKILLTEQWYPMIPLFRYLCLVQIFVAMSAVNGFVHSALGRPGRNLILNITLAIFMPVSFFFALQHGINAILIPWFTTYLMINISWFIYSLQKIDIPLISYLKSLRFPFIASSMMLFIIVLFEHFIGKIYSHIPIYSSLSINVTIGSAVYVLFLWKFDSDLVRTFRLLIKK